jgi:hypothetical protein
MPKLKCQMNVKDQNTQIGLTETFRHLIIWIWFVIRILTFVILKYVFGAVINAYGSVSKRTEARSRNSGSRIEKPHPKDLNFKIYIKLNTRLVNVKKIYGSVSGC